MIKANLKELLEKMAHRWAVVLFSLLLFGLVLGAAFSLFSYFRGGNAATSTASGRHNLGFRVFYLENRMFPTNPVPPNLDFLMSYTDFIEIDSGFTASFSEETDIHYSYSAEKRFIIRPMGAEAHRFVFEEVFPMSQASGRLQADRLYFPAENNGGPGGIYTIFPKKHIETYFNFVEDQARQMEAENVVAPGLRGFSAELLINFTYTIYAPGLGLNETITNGYRLQLTTEVYYFAATGLSNFEWQSDLAIQEAGITLPTVILFVVAFALSLFGLLYNIRGQRADPNTGRREANNILRKYPLEIVIYDKPTDLTRHEPRNVQDFGELLKLAINLNKHIMCYRDDKHTEFAVIVDEYACMYMIDYESADTRTPILMNGE